MTKPLVSILIPAYNAREWIEDTVRSAVAQTWKRTEIIVVDDGSTDSTLAVLEKFKSQGVRVITQKNQGAATARNTALSLSQGDYIQYLDADDLLSPDKIAKQVEALRGGGHSKRTLYSSAWGHFLFRYHRAKFVPTPLWCDLSPTEFLIRKMGQNLFMQTSTWLVSRELTEAAGPWDVALLTDDDGEYFCRVLLASDGIRFVPEGKVYYRASQFNSVSFIGLSNPKCEAQWRSINLHIGYLRSLEDSPRVHAACVKYLQDWLISFYPERPDIVRKAERIAQHLGGELKAPHLSWKYSWIRVLFGWRLAKRAQLFLPRVRQTFVRFWDKMFLSLEKRKWTTNSNARGGTG
ncbi:MAG: hypothetical protein PVS2B2_17930 [Candidatus Acidiferrum sp.]